MTPQMTWSDVGVQRSRSYLAWSLWWRRHLCQCCSVKVHLL